MATVQANGGITFDMHGPGLDIYNWHALIDPLCHRYLIMDRIHLYYTTATKQVPMYR